MPWDSNREGRQGPAIYAKTGPTGPGASRPPHADRPSGERPMSLTFTCKLGRSRREGWLSMQAGDIQDMYRSRRRSEAEASSPPESIQNRLLVASLTELLDARKSVTSSAELEALAKRYHVDVAKVQQLSRVVNTPSIDERTVVRTTDKHGEESLTMMVSVGSPRLSCLAWLSGT